MIRRILVGLGDANYAASATRTAIELAKSHGAQLTGISVLDPHRVGATGPVPIGAGSIAKELRQHRLATAIRIIEEVDADFLTNCNSAGVVADLKQPSGDPYECMASQARYHDIVVCGLGHLFEHGVVEEPPADLVKLVQSGVRPLIAVTAEYRPIHRVLIAYSGSMESAKAMKRFIQLRLWPDVKIRIATFGHKPEKANALLADARQYCSYHGLNAETEPIEESPKRAILPYADQWHADLIVMGNSNRNLLLRRMFGETMLYAVKHADRPLFLAQ